MKRVYNQPKIEVLNLQPELTLLTGSATMSWHSEEADEVW